MDRPCDVATFIFERSHVNELNAMGTDWLRLFTGDICRVTLCDSYALGFNERGEGFAALGFAMPWKPLPDQLHISNPTSLSMT